MTAGIRTGATIEAELNSIKGPAKASLLAALAAAAMIAGTRESAATGDAVQSINSPRPAMS